MIKYGQILWGLALYFLITCIETEWGNVRQIKNETIRWGLMKYRRLPTIFVYMKISNFASFRGDCAMLKFRWKMYLEKRSASGTMTMAIERSRVSPTFHLIATRRRNDAFSSYIDFKFFEISIFKGFINLNEFLSNGHGLTSNPMVKGSFSIALWNFFNFFNFFKLSRSSRWPRNFSIVLE